MVCGGGGGFVEVCGKLVDELNNYPGGWVFCEPVDPVKFNIPDYFSIIKRTMDLGTVKRSLDRGFYFDGGEFAANVRLTFANAMSYNPPCNDVHVLAKRLDDRFNRRWESIEATNGSGEQKSSRKYCEFLGKFVGKLRSEVKSKGCATLKETQNSSTPKLDFEVKSEEVPCLTDSSCIPMSPRQASRAAMLKRRFADTIFKAMHPEFDGKCRNHKSNSLCGQRARKRQRKELEQQQQQEKSRTEAENRVAEANSRRLQIERERATARMALEPMERSVVIEENAGILNVDHQYINQDATSPNLHLANLGS